jgi:hypothetical protein
MIKYIPPTCSDVFASVQRCSDRFAPLVSGTRSWIT